MEALLTFAAVLLALTPLVIALVKAISDDAPRLPRWGKRLLAVAFGVALAFTASYLMAVYASVTIPAAVVAICGIALGINAAGVYDVSSLLGGGQTSYLYTGTSLTAVEPERVGEPDVVARE